MKTIKIWTQDDFRRGIVPKPGMIFAGDDNNYYRILDHHPDLKAGEFGIKFSAQPLPEGKEAEHPEQFWAAIQLIDREVAAIVHGRRA